MTDIWQIYFLILLSVCRLSFPTSTKRSLPNLHKGLSLSPKLIRRSTNCHCPPPKKYKLQFRLFLPSSALHLLLVVALQGAVTWHYDHFFPFNLAKTKQRENLNLAQDVLKDCHTNGQKFRFPKIAVVRLFHQNCTKLDYLFKIFANYFTWRLMIKLAHLLFNRKGNHFQNRFDHKMLCFCNTWFHSHWSKLISGLNSLTLETYRMVKSNRRKM